MKFDQKLSSLFRSLIFIFIGTTKHESRYLLGDAVFYNLK